MKSYRDEIDERIAVDSRMGEVEISPVMVKATRIRATFTLPGHSTHEMHTLARGLVDGSLFAGCDIQSATVEQTSILHITRKVKR